MLELVDCCIDEINTLTEAEKHDLLLKLEDDKVLLFPQSNFTLTSEELMVLDPTLLDPKKKNMSYNPVMNNVKGVGKTVNTHQRDVIFKLMQRFHKWSVALMQDLAPEYMDAIKLGRASFRPADVNARELLSVRKDDRLLHVDAFPSSPVQNMRILRLFININPNDQSRDWRLGEPFKNVMDRFVKKIKPSPSVVRHIMKTLKITKNYRTAYDDIMLKMHHKMKLDAAYQQQFQKIYKLPADAAWLVYTDAVSHAAMAGQHLLEQTFYLPVDSMLDPARSPLRQLEHFTAKKLLA